MVSDQGFIRHVIDRLGYGAAPGDLDRIAALGPERWIAQQLDPASIPLPPELMQRLAGMATLRMTPQQLFLEYGPRVGLAPGAKLTDDEKMERERRFRFVAEQTIDARLLRAVASPRQFEESLTEFWSNHFNVFIGKELDRIWTGAYVEEAIRPHVLGRFRDLLFATAKHPAMLLYLDNWQNTAPGSPGARGPFEGINENYAREVMELHTLGVDGGYSQTDVTALARILTGWTIGPIPERRPAGPRPMFPFFRAPDAMRGAPDAMRRTSGARAEGRGTFAFAEDRHDFTDKLFLGRTFRGAGQAEGEAALDMLAASPATARHVSLKLAQFYVADAPDKGLVDAMTKTFQASGGDIRAVLKVMLASPSFRAPQGFATRFKTPYRYVVSALRASGTDVKNFRPIGEVLNQLGERPYACLMPDGYKVTEDAWLNPDAMMRRISFVVAFAHGNLPLDTPPPDQPARPGMARLAAFDTPRTPLDAAVVLAAAGDRFSAQTRAAANEAAPELRAAILLGSPEFMRF